MALVICNHLLQIVHLSLVLINKVIPLLRTSTEEETTVSNREMHMNRDQLPRENKEV